MYWVCGASVTFLQSTWLSMDDVVSIMPSTITSQKISSAISGLVDIASHFSEKQCVCVWIWAHGMATGSAGKCGRYNPTTAEYALERGCKSILGKERFENPLPPSSVVWMVSWSDLLLFHVSRCLCVSYIDMFSVWLFSRSVSHAQCTNLSSVTMQTIPRRTPLPHQCWEEVMEAHTQN